jgi:hypothetical protein
MKTLIATILFILFGFGTIASLFALDLAGAAFCGLVAYVCHKIAF